jgi:methanogenic corrinoid protein MtbC1
VTKALAEAQRLLNRAEALFQKKSLTRQDRLDGGGLIARAVRLSHKYDFTEIIEDALSSVRKAAEAAAKRDRSLEQERSDSEERTTDGSLLEHLDRLREAAADFLRSSTSAEQVCVDAFDVWTTSLSCMFDFGRSEPVTDNFLWLADVLCKRGFTLQELAKFAEELSQSFAPRLPRPASTLLKNALRVAKDRLGDGGITFPLGARRCPLSWPATEPFMRALLAADEPSARALLNQSLSPESPFIERAQHVLQPAMYRIGQRWQAARWSTAEEHAATAIASRILAGELLRRGPDRTEDKLIVLACVERNHHQLGLEVVALAFKSAGWEVRFLGADVPTSDIVAYAANSQPDVLGLSLSLAAHFRPARDIIARLDDGLGFTRPGVLVGGLAVNDFPQVKERLGCDASAPDASKAVIAAEQLLNRVVCKQ